MLKPFFSLSLSLGYPDSFVFVFCSFHTLVIAFLLSACSDEEVEGVIPREKLVALCKYEPVRLWMRSCDHVLYQALVEILIPDVLRPVPSQYYVAFLVIINIII